MKVRFRFLAPVLLGLCALPVVAARTLVVDPTRSGADDRGPGTEERPFRTISQAAATAKAGDTVRIQSGVYRETVRILASGTAAAPIRFEAAPGATVIVTGADELTGWSRAADGTCTVPWSHRLFQGDEHNPGGVDQVLVDGVLLRKAASRADLAAGTFAVDPAAGQLHCRPPAGAAAGARVEASTRPLLWWVEGAHVHTRGLRFRYAANRAQHGMAQFLGVHARVEDCVFEWANSTGADFRAADITVRRCVFQDNGQQGFKGLRAHRLLFEDCTVQRNNVKNFPRGWEAGGNKICYSRGVVLERSRFLANRGSGVWFDITNVDCTVRHCLIADNEDAGIFYEISFGLHAHDNVIVGNGLARTKGAWGANGGICISSSPGCVIERNLLVGNLQGFCFREQNRRTPPLAALALPPEQARQLPEEPVWNHDEVIRDNLIADNAAGQVQGWFDIATERHWPRARQSVGATAQARPRADVAAGYQARDDGVPPGLSLEDLRIAFSGNSYAPGPGQPLFIWGANWKRRVEYKTLAELRQALGFEDERSVLVPPLPDGGAERDFRLPRGHPALARGCYPRGPVPGAQLGVRD